MGKKWSMCITWKRRKGGNHFYMQKVILPYIHSSQKYIPWRYPIGYWVIARTKIFGKKLIKGACLILKVRKVEHHSCVRHDLLTLHTFLYNCMKISNGFWVMACTIMFWKNNQRGLSWKQRKGEQSFLCAIRRPDLIHTPIKLHEDIPEGYWVMGDTRFFMDGRTAPYKNTSVSFFYKMGV